MPMPMTPEVRNRLLVATRGAAIAFIEDMSHLREISTRENPSAGELRRVSNELRRLLVDNGGDLSGIAAPRIGRLMFKAPDNNPIYRAEHAGPYSYWASGAGEFFGLALRSISVSNSAIHRVFKDFDPSRTVDLTLDGFLGQRLICLMGKWVTRRQVIKYIANTASGVHSGTPQEEADNLQARVRQCVNYSSQNDEFKIHFNVDAFNPAIKDIPFKYQQGAIDPVLVELLSTAQSLTQSPRILELEAVVQEELRMAG
jgi:hypothetical protein